MRILLVESGKVPRPAEIGDGLEPMQAVVGGAIQAVYPFEEPVALVCNEEGKCLGLPLNRVLRLDSGKIFGNLGRGFQRVNVACPRATLTEALERIRRVFTD